MNEICFDTLNNAAGAINKLKITSNLNDAEVVVLSDEHQLSYLLCGTLELIKKKTPGMQVALVIDGEPKYPEALENVLTVWPELIIYKSLDIYFEKRSNKKQIMFDYANLRHEMYRAEAVKEQRIVKMKRIFADLNANHLNQYQLITCIPDIKNPLPSVTNAIAEREYEVIMRDCPKDSLEKYVIRLEDFIRSYTELLPRVQVIRQDRVYGPGITVSDDIWVMDVISDIYSKKKVTIYDKDRHDIASASYVRDALLGVVVAMLSGRKGNIYHVTSHELSRFQIISDLLRNFPECECCLETEHEQRDNSIPLQYRMLNARKLRLAHSSKLETVLYSKSVESLKKTMLWYQSVTAYIPTTGFDVYYGRMSRIRQMELAVLDEIDAICKEHNINYFLTAGTMLGAVRHKEFIPWDDDVDIGMLPEDYFKFLKVCPSRLSVDYGYQNFATEQTSHYIHDKIRVKNTFFSTKYSDQYPMMNGVYIDVFVYFKTSNIPFMQKFHLWYIQVVRRLIGLRWADRPRKNLHYYKSMVALPIMRLFPFLWLHKYYIHVLSWYEKRKTHFRVDSMGFNLKKVGAVPDEWFHGTVEAEFCGKKYPILAHYNDFLSHWYTNKYMELLPVSSRKSVHDVVRIDLGQNLFDETTHDPAFRDVDLRGELFETYK